MTASLSARPSAARALGHFQFQIPGQRDFELELLVIHLAEDVSLFNGSVLRGWASGSGRWRLDLMM